MDVLGITISQKKNNALRFVDVAPFGYYLLSKPCQQSNYLLQIIHNLLYGLSLIPNIFIDLLRFRCIQHPFVKHPG
jgi:hypothetical protein